MKRGWRIGIALCALGLPLSGCDLHETLFGFPVPTITTTGTAPIEIGFRTSANGLMLIKGTVARPGGAHADVEFIVDTGAPVTVLVDGPGTTALGLDTSKSTRLGPADNPAVPFGVIEPGFSVDFGALRYSSLTTVVIAQRGFPCQERFARVGFQGIIGADLFKAFVVEVDAPGRRLRLHRPQAFMPGDLQPIPLTFINGHPHIDTQIVTATGSYNVRLHVDTGSTNVAVFEPGVRPGVVAAPGGKKGASCFVSGELETATGLPLTVMLDRWQARVDEPVLAAKERVNDASASGSIGAPLLARFRYAIDYPGKRLWIGAQAN